MRLRCFCNKIPTGLLFNFLVFLLPSVIARRNPDHIYFSNRPAEILLKGPESLENSEYVLKWKPHSGQKIQTLGTFYKQYWGNWRIKWNDHFKKSDLYQQIRQVYDTINVRIRYPTFSFAGLFTLTQMQPKKQILKQYEIFGLKVETSPGRPVVGSDVTLSCTISRLSDTVSLHWKRVDSSQQNRTNTDQIRLNNTVHLIIRQVTVEDGKAYVCEVQENGSIVHTAEADVSVTKEIYQSRITLYRSSTDHSELHLNCYLRRAYFRYAEWTWSSYLHQIQEKEIATASKSQSVCVNSTYFGNRLQATMPMFNGNDFNARIAPVLFEDAGVYKCNMDSILIVTTKLITVKVMAEPSDAVTEGDTITLTCSVSDVTESMRLVWINGDGKTVGEKTLNGEEKSLSLIIQKADRDRWKWKCGLIYQDRPQLLAPYYLEPSGSRNSVYFFHQEGNFVLKGPDNPGNDSIVWEWRPHSGQQITKRLATFHREDQRWAVQWTDEYSKIPGISQRMRVDWGTPHLRIRKPTFELAGLFTWAQTQPGGEILREWEVFGIKVEADPQRPVMGSDITLSCTISRLPDTVSLHWKLRGSSQQNRSNSDQIHLNNTVYLMVQHVGAGNPNLYTWEVQENGSIALTGDTNVEVDQDLHNKMYTVYRSDTGHSELDLICEASAKLTETKWTWRSQHFQNQEKEIASTRRSEPIIINRTYFGDRLRTTMGNQNGKNFSVRIVSVQFEDAGVYSCCLESYKYVTIKLVTVKVTAEPSDAVMEGNTVTLNCSVSEVIESMSLAWFNSDGKTVEEETFNEQRQEAKSLQLIILKADGGRRKWTCGLFHQNMPKVFIPYYLKVKRHYHFKHTPVVITGCLALLLIIILAVVLCLRKCKLTDLGSQRQKPPQPKGNTEDDSYLYSNPKEIHQNQGGNKTPVPEASQVAEYMSVNRKLKKEGVNKTPHPETSHFAEYSNVNRKPIQKDTEEDIHYGSISFQSKTPGHRHGVQFLNQPSNFDMVSSKEDDSSVIYAQIAQTKM